MSQSPNPGERDLPALHISEIPGQARSREQARRQLHAYLTSLGLIVLGFFLVVITHSEILR